MRCRSDPPRIEQPFKPLPCSACVRCVVWYGVWCVCCVGVLKVCVIFHPLLPRQRFLFLKRDRGGGPVLKRPSTRRRPGSQYCNCNCTLRHARNTDWDARVVPVVRNRKGPSARAGGVCESGVVAAGRKWSLFEKTSELIRCCAASVCQEQANQQHCISHSITQEFSCSKKRNYMRVRRFPVSTDNGDEGAWQSRLEDPTPTLN